MRESRKFFIFAALLTIAAILKFSNRFQYAMENIDTFRGALVADDVFQPLIAKSANGKALTLTVDGSTLTNKNTGIYMDEKLNIMIPVSALKDTFQCSARIYHENELVLQKYETEVRMKLSDPSFTVNGETVEIPSPLVKNHGEYFVPAQVVADYLSYSYNFDIDSNTALVSNTSEETTVVPLAYDLREQGRTSVIKNQGKYGTCWAFAALSALESSLLPGEAIEFSPDHMSLKNSFQLTQDDGGDYTMGMAYLASWQGPVLETQDPYGDGKAEDGLKASKHVQEIQILKSKDFTAIKKAVFQYGGVQSSIYSTLKSSKSESEFYNSSACAYCYQGTEKPNHDIVIIGWDDNYPKSNFKMEPEGDGAFICQNSWGDGFGDGGVFYISYYDANIGIHNEVYTEIAGTDNYDNIYQTDLCGWVGQLGYNGETAYGANCYVAEGEELLQAVGFYATDQNTSYEVSVVTGFEEKESLSTAVVKASGTLQNAGYYTIDFEQAVQLKPQEKYAVIVKLTTPGSVHPLAVEYVSDETMNCVDLSDGEGYISKNGTKWERVETNQGCNLCLKAYTSNEK